MIDVLKGYLQVASGVTQVTRQKAMVVARQVLEGSPVAGVLPAVGQADQLSQQVSALADELLEVGRQNRAVLVDLVRAEIETVVTRLGLAGTAELESALAASRARVVELERELTRRDSSPSSSAAAASSGRRTAPAAKKATAKTSTAKTSTAKTSTAKKATAKKATAKKATAKKATAKKATAKKATAKRSTAKRSATKRSTARPTGTGS